MEADQRFYLDEGTSTHPFTIREAPFVSRVEVQRLCRDEKEGQYRSAS